jgi:phosphoribosylformylglycinamidine synthase
MFEKFFTRKETFTLGVCNGCQMLSQLKEIIPGANHWPRFLRNESEQFEARFASVKINDSPSVMLAGMAGSILPIPVAHGEGRALFSSNKAHNVVLKNGLAPMQYVDNHGDVTHDYPLNPNGSPSGITALTSEDGRATIMMPHPERAFLTQQNSWHPQKWDKYGPWLNIFQNARDWVEKHK